MHEQRTLWIAAMIVGAACLLPLLGFVLYALWPWRVLVSWFAFGMIGATMMVRLGLETIRVVVALKLQVAEAALRHRYLQAQERSQRNEGIVVAYQEPQQGRGINRHATFFQGPDDEIRS
jgi:MFS family permease